MDSLVTIIIPIYKVQDYLEECLESVVHQTYENLQIILVDDGSPDKCATVCDKYATLDKRIAVTHKRNGGLSSARNAGLEIISGDYVLFVDSDDVVSIYAVEALLNKALATKSDIVQGKNILLSDEIIDKRPEITSCRTYTSHEYLSLLFSRAGNNDTRIVVVNKLYKASLFSELRFAEGIINEDEEITPSLIYRANKICVIGNPLYYYRVVANSISHSAFSEKNYDIMKAKRKNIVFLTKHGEDELLKPYLVTYLFDLFNLYYQTVNNEFSNERKREVKKEIDVYFSKAFKGASPADKLRLLKNKIKILKQ